MYDLRPTPDEYRNVCNLLVQAFAELYAEPRQARRAFAAAVDARGRVAALFTLRTAPERFGGLLLVELDPRVRDFADEAAESFALCREHCTRPLIRDAARLLALVHAARVLESRRREARSDAAVVADQIREARERREWCERLEVRALGLAGAVYADPRAALDAALAYGRAHGHSAFWRDYYHNWKRFGTPRRTTRADWLGWFGFTDVKEAEEGRVSFRGDAASLIESIPRTKDAEWFACKQAEQQAADEAVAALEAERLPTPDPGRTLRQAAQLVHDAMRLLERFPSDAAPHVTRQLAALLPDDAHAGYVVADAVRVAGKYESASEDRRGRGRERRRDDDWRDRSSSYGR